MDRDSCKKRAKKLARKTKELTEEVEAKDEMAKLVEKDRWGIQAKAIQALYNPKMKDKVIREVADSDPGVSTGRIRSYIDCEVCGKKGMRIDSYKRHIQFACRRRAFAKKEDKSMHECPDCGYETPKR